MHPKIYFYQLNFIFIRYMYDHIQYHTPNIYARMWWDEMKQRRADLISMYLMGGEL